MTAMTAENLDVVRCSMCDSPVVKSASTCQACKTPLNGSEAQYRVYQPHAPAVRPLLFEYALIAALFIAIGSYFPQGGLSFVLILLSGFYAWRLFKRLV